VAGFLAAWDVLNVASPGVTALRMPSYKPLHGTVTSGGMIKDAQRAMKKAGRGTRRAADEAAKATTWKAREARVLRDGLSGAVREAAHARGVRELRGVPGADGGLTALERTARDVKAEVSAASAAEQAAETAAWLARCHVLESAGKPEPIVRSMADVYLPLVDAVESGLRLFWITEESVLAVAACDTVRGEITIDRPRDVVWRAFTDTSEQARRDFLPFCFPMFTGWLERVEPGWQAGGLLVWMLGEPTKISALVPGETVTFDGSAANLGKRTWSFSDAGPGSTLLACQVWEYYFRFPEHELQSLKERVESQAERE